MTKTPKQKRKPAPKKPGPKGLTDARYEKALRENAGIQSLAARDLGVARSTVFERVQNSAHLQRVIQDVKETLLDVAEGVIANAITGKDLQTTRWYLTQQGKSRGYANRSEVDARLPEDQFDALVGAFGGDVERLRALRSAIDPSKTSE